MSTPPEVFMPSFNFIVWLCRQKNDIIYMTLFLNHVFFEARKIRKRGQLFGAWTQGGNVLIKLNQNDIPHVVSSITNLKTLVQNYIDSDDESWNNYNASWQKLNIILILYCNFCMYVKSVIISVTEVHRHFPLRWNDRHHSLNISFSVIYVLNKYHIIS